MKSIEQILRPYVNYVDIDSEGTCGYISYGNAIKAVQEYADQQTVDFVKWLIKNYVQSAYDNLFFLPNGEGGWAIEELLTKYKEVTNERQNSKDVCKRY